MERLRPCAASDNFLLRERMPELDTLRGIAILLVLFLHGFGWTFDPQRFSGWERLFLQATTYGWVGVQLFFVLSGFLITGILLDSKARPDYYRRFYLRRALRILPAYYALLFALMWIGSKPVFAGHLVKLPFILGSFLYLSNLTPLFGIAIQYTVLWSLAVEEHFYLVWPWIVRLLSRRRLTFIAAGVVVLSPVVRLCGLRFGDIVNQNFYTWCNLDGLAMGALVAILLRVPGLPRKRIAGWGLGVGIFALGCFAVGVALHLLTWTSPTGFALRLSFLNLGFTSLLIMTLLVGTSRWGALVNIRWLRFVGEISYGLYLYHMLFFHAFNHTIERYWPSWAPSHRGFPAVSLQFVIAAAASIGFATLSRYYFEGPFLKLKDRLGAATGRAQAGRITAVRELSGLHERSLREQSI